MPYTPIHQSSRANIIYVEEGPKRAAMARLHERIASGESPFEILGIAENEKYYVDKIVAGLIPITYALYGRIMNLDEEDAFDQ